MDTERQAGTLRRVLPRSCVELDCDGALGETVRGPLSSALRAHGSETEKARRQLASSGGKEQARIEDREFGCWNYIGGSTLRAARSGWLFLGRGNDPLSPERANERQRERERGGVALYAAAREINNV